MRKEDEDQKRREKGYAKFTSVSSPAQNEVSPVQSSPPSLSLV
jgi:hypothetical protein